jgi:hypothetical protein
MSLRKLVTAFLSRFRLPLSSSQELAQKVNQGCPEWMAEAIKRDLTPFRNLTLSLKKMTEEFLNIPLEYTIVKFQISENRVFVEQHFPGDIDGRIKTYKNKLQKLCSTFRMPNLTFFICIHDGLYRHFVECLSSDFPLFGMSKDYRDQGILMPDYQSLTEKYQVLKGLNIDITNYTMSWRKKIPMLIWRGSTMQNALDSSTCYLTQENLQLFNRVRLCELSRDFPHLINAKFTSLVNGGEFLPYIQSLEGRRMSYLKQIRHKYQMLIDGNASSYNASGWRFFADSLVFKPDSNMVQWYFSALKPFEHYLPVKTNLEDLVEKVQWARKHDAEAERVAHNGCEFARNFLKAINGEVYLYYLLQEYSRLNFIE